MASAPSASPSDARAAASSFFGGAGAFFRGLGFVVGRPAVWPLAAVPVLVAVVLTLILGALGIRAAGAAVEALGAPSSALGEAGTWLARALLYVVALVAAAFGGLALAQPLSAPALDAIVRAQERALGVPLAADAATGGALASFGRGLRVTLVTLAVGVPVLGLLTVVDMLFPPAAVVTFPLKLCASALLATWNMVDYPFALRGAGVRARWAWFRANAAASFGFGLVLAALALVPFLGFLMLPVGVAGATRLVVSTQPAVPRSR